MANVGTGAVFHRDASVPPGVSGCERGVLFRGRGGRGGGAGLGGGGFGLQPTAKMPKVFMSWAVGVPPGKKEPA
ncbi:hypothetical protein DI273_07290 [Streptomyces violascens]|nr:hypothetical protein DI273_07290 [Streptomyces violascens]